ncbi:cytochrome c3 family protein [Labilibaculum manganireducens]|uniref:cytochrome c3 family protein n=1 Tax=Labilibaculum manganireducens TaxID=1940525 RepID=UPI0029F51BC4|nr:cytochrome c3 family protein [Labilibaculum manganireducens]
MSRPYGFFYALIILFLLFSPPALLAIEADSTHVAENDHHHFNYFLNSGKRGERLFKGLTRIKTDVTSCVSCHNIEYIDTLNWNPSAMDIAGTYADKSIAEFKSVLMSPLGKKMEASHVGYTYSDEELRYIKSYLVQLKEDTLHEAKPKVNNLIVFFFLGALLTMALIDLFFTKKIKYKFIPILIFVLAFGYQINMLADGAMALGRKQNYQPAQPIKFSHKVHVTGNKIDCRYCHTTADESKSAGIPHVNLCMNCHIIVREGPNSGKFEINKIIKAVENNTSVEWVRIHQLPDHVFFSHAQHANVGKRECQECHGPVEEMDVIKQVEDLSMGWCLDCHDKTAVDFQANGYYSNGFKKLHEDLAAGVIDSVRVTDIGGRECARCHY